LLDECNLGPNVAVLDVATGPGTVARLAAKRIGPGRRIVATDISRPMLDVANSKPSSPDSAPITHIESPAAPLGVESAAFDFVVGQQGLQFFPDRLAALSLIFQFTAQVADRHRQGVVLFLQCNWQGSLPRSAKGPSGQRQSGGQPSSSSQSS
jgi:ubiquinone/menaquinone biosynthesis C-methylase UbiE